MLKNYFKIAWRQLLKHRLHSAINITGLAVSIASFIIILVYFNYELSYDKWDPSLSRVFKLYMQQEQDIRSNTPAPLADLLRDHYPNTEAATAIIVSGDYEALLAAGEKKIYQKGVITTDSLFLKVFPYELLEGDPATALNAPNAVLLSEEVSRKLFGAESPLGKPVRLYNRVDGVVTGVLKKPAGPSHLNVNLLARDRFEKQNKFWENYSYQTYVRTKTATQADRLQDQVSRLFYSHRIKKDNQSYEDYRKTPAPTLLLADGVQQLHNFPEHGESRFKITLILLILAVFLLVAGAINFSNLAVARAITRAKEVGLRKAMGSRRGHIILQSLMEVTLQCLISLLLALALVYMALPWFSKNFDIPLDVFNAQYMFKVLLQVAGSFLLIIAMAGLYPAVFLSRHETAQVLRGSHTRGAKGLFFRNSLLVVQLTLAAVFITGLIVINRQMHFMQRKDLGFDPSQVISIRASQQSRENNFASVRSRLSAVPGVEYVAKSTAVPGSNILDTTTYKFRCEGKEVRLNSVKVSVDYFKTMNIRLQQGRLFEEGRPEDLDNTAILNEAALRQLGVANPLGRLIYFPWCDSIPYTIVGIVRDFNVQGLESHVQPAIYTTSNAHCIYQSGGAILVKIRTGNVRQTLAGIAGVWKGIEPDEPLRYTFLDQDFQNLFREYARLEKVILFFTIISIAITMIGLFSLTSFLAQQRVKEIGIRKVLGASVGSITALLSKDFVKLAVIAIMIAMPLAWWLLSQWLNAFAYRISLSWPLFALAGILTVIITIATVSLQAVKAARANPASSLSTE